MIDLNAFVDELEKIGAQKCRKGSMPIRAGNLAKKEKYDGRGKRVTKLATPQLILDFLKKFGKTGTEGKGMISPKTLALLGLGTVGGAKGKSEYDKWQYGRRTYPL